MNKLLGDINKVSYNLLLQEPFYGHLLVGLVRQSSEEEYDISLGVHGSFIKLSVGSRYWFKQTSKVKTGLIKHELLHICFKHPLRCTHFNKKNLAILAADLLVNQFLDACELPEGAFTLAFLSELSYVLEPNKSLDYYYEKLEKIFEKLMVPDDEKCTLEEKEQTLLSTLDSLEKSSHSQWRGFTTKTSQHALIEHNIDTLLLNVANKLDRNNSWGNISHTLKEYIQQITLLSPPKVDWKKQLRLFVASSQKTFVKNTLSRPSKRYGTRPGIKIKRRCKILLAIDTSGSLSAKDISTYFNEIYHLWQQKVDITIVECDLSINKIYKYKGKMPSFVTGRGGTDFNAPILYNNDTFRGDALVYFTDGYADTPTAISNKPLMWLIYNNDKEKLTCDLKGRIVTMRN